MTIKSETMWMAWYKLGKFFSLEDPPKESKKDLIDHLIARLGENGIDDLVPVEVHITPIQPKKRGKG